MEDELSEHVLRRLLAGRKVHYSIEAVFRRDGAGCLRRNCVAWNKTCANSPVLLLTDLDRHPCPIGLLQEWLPYPRHPNFLFRVAVREVEAWLLGSDASFGQFLGLRGEVRLSDHPERLSDPKMELLKLAERSPRRDIRESLSRRDYKNQLKQGPAYNSTLAGFVAKEWDVKIAARRCLSLGRFLSALAGIER